MNDLEEQLKRTRDGFVAQWGSLGTPWGFSRTMTRIHAFLMTTQEALSTDQVMDELQISRGNAHANLKELVAWGLLRVVVKKGERREYFEAEKDAWQVFTAVAKERKRREVEPALAVLRKCAEESRGIESPEARELSEQLRRMGELVELAARITDRIVSMKHGDAMLAAVRLLG